MPTSCGYARSIPAAGVVEVVCGAPNARTGLVGVFAPTGTYVPGTGVKLEAKPVRGVVSNGMLCSERELELSNDHDGIIELPAELASRLGERYVDVMGLDDPVFEVKVTPNRPDALAIRGIARDLAACGLGTLKPADQATPSRAPSSARSPSASTSRRVPRTPVRHSPASTFAASATALRRNGCSRG